MSRAGAVLEKESSANTLTYEEYMAEGEINRRYDIIDGERIFMTQPTDGHQEIVLNIAEQFRSFQRSAKIGRALVSPCDILITPHPLRIRQSDVLFVSKERYKGRSPQEASPWSPAPELVVEVLSPSEYRAVRLAKIMDYCAVDVKECWVVSPEGETVEVLSLTPSGPERRAIYDAGQAVTSLTFPELTLSLDDIFRIEEE